MKIAITGASSGLGWQLALELAGEGKELVLLGRDLPRLLQLKTLAEKKGSTCDLCVADLLLQEGLQKAITVLEAFCPELLIQCAGIGRYGHFCDVEKDESLDILRLNVLAVIETTHAWAQCVKKKHLKKLPKVVFIASSAAFLPIPGMAVYAASKACLLSFAEALRFEERGKIDVLTACPGRFRTNFQRRAAHVSLGDPSTEEARVVAKKIIARLCKNGVYVPFPWNVLLLLKKILPQWLLMRLVEKKVYTQTS